jgi:O-antigen/teichoic acid export membrane protein
MMRQKIIKGGAALAVRQVISLPFNALGVALASRFLLPADYGIQAILIPIIALAVMMIDLGTSQALVQRRERPSGPLLRRVQILKFSCSVAVLLVLTLISAWLVRVFDLPQNLIWIFPACGFVGWLQSQRAFQAVALQRHIDWSLLAKVEMAEIVIYNVVLIIAAYHFRSAWCFIIALGFRMGAGAIILKIVSCPKVENEAASGSRLRALLGYGVPLQSATLLSVIMNSANPIVVGSSLGIQAVGYVNWSNNIVSVPQVPLQPLPNFLFSVLAERGRQGRDDQKLIAELSYLGASLMSMFSLIIIMTLNLLVQNILGVQWREAIPAASILLLTNVVVVPSLIITAQMNAGGHSALSLLISGVGVFLLWTMVIVAALLKAGLTGYALGVLLATLVTFGFQTKIASKRLSINVSFMASLRYIVYIVSCGMIAKMLIKAITTTSGIIEEFALIITAVLIFVAMVALFEGRYLKPSFAVLKSTVHWDKGG